MPNYTFLCQICEERFPFFCGMEERDEVNPDCPACNEPFAVVRTVDAPAVMNVAMADGTRRFDNVRRFRELEKAKRAETDKVQQERIDRDMKKLTGAA